MTFCIRNNADDSDIKDHTIINELDEDLQSLLMNEITDPNNNFIETGEDLLWELETDNFIVTVSLYVKNQLMLDCVVTYKSTNSPVTILPVTAGLILEKISKILLG